MNDNGRAIVWATIVATLFAGLGFGSGWLSAQKADAAWHQKVDSHIAESDHIWANAAQEHDQALENKYEIDALRKDVAGLVQSQQKLTDKMDLIVQGMMRRGEIAR